MTACIAVNADGSLVVTADTSCTTTEYVLISASDYAILRDPWGNTNPDWNTAVWASGATILMWTVGIAAGAIVNVIKKARA